MYFFSKKIKNFLNNKYYTFWNEIFYYNQEDLKKVLLNWIIKMAHKNDSNGATIPSWMADVKEDAIKTQVCWILIWFWSFIEMITKTNFLVLRNGMNWRKAFMMLLNSIYLKVMYPILQIWQTLRRIFYLNVPLVH